MRLQWVRCDAQCPPRQRPTVGAGASQREDSPARLADHARVPYPPHGHIDLPNGRNGCIYAHAGTNGNGVEADHAAARRGATSSEKRENRF